jgi:hypothetical protein
MPYIEKKRREDIEKTGHPYSAGELNYLITKACTNYMKNFISISYPEINSIIGALECAKQEFYRRVVVPYEEIKKEVNGDVY